MPRKNGELRFVVLIISMLTGAIKSLIVSMESDPEEEVSLEAAVEYMVKNKPLPDNVTQNQLITNAGYALKTRHFPYTSQVSNELFLTNVLPYRHFDEPVDDWRGKFYDTMLPYVKGKKSLQEAAEALFPAWSNAFGTQLQFQSNMTPQVLAPISETLKLGYASCTGMSIFLANCLRAVGIPARIVGVAEWNREEHGNHNWVEVWTGSGWSFVDAVPTGDIVTWNQTWFRDQATRQQSIPLRHAILSPLWGSQADTAYNISWRSPTKFIPAIDVTRNYAVPSEPTSEPASTNSIVPQPLPWWSQWGRAPLFVIMFFLMILLVGGVGCALKKPSTTQAGYHRFPR